MKKSLIGLLSLLLLTSCNNLGNSSNSHNLTSDLSNKKREISWYRMPVISSFLKEKFALSDFGSVTIQEIDGRTFNYELEKSNYSDFSNVDYFSMNEQTITANYEELSIDFKFTLKEKEVNLSSVELVKAMGVGYNLGDTFESDIGNYFTNANPTYAKAIYDELGYSDIDGKPDELFCEVRQHYTPYRGKTTQNTIRAIYDKGFRSIRIPVAWSNHMENGNISTRWMNRIKEVVDYCFKYKDLYVILTLMEPPSFSGYWLDNEHKDTTEALVKNVWTQVSKEFARYDYRLIFENLNEPLHYKYQWQMSSVMETNPQAYKEANENLMYFNQLFVDIVRKSKETNNKNRFLTVNTYGNMAYLAYEEKVNKISKFSFPLDNATDKLLFNVHGYNPYNYVYGKSDSWSSANNSDTSGIVGLFNNLKSNFVDKGIGVIVTEWGAVHDAKDSKEREDTRKDYYSYFMKQATINDIGIMMWDNTAIKDSWKEGFGFLNRHKAAGIYDAMKNISNTNYDNETLWFYEEILDVMFNSYLENK